MLDALDAGHKTYLSFQQATTVDETCTGIDNMNGDSSKTTTIEALPAAVILDVSKTALICIDFQTDFLVPGGFGDALGNDVNKVQRAVAPAKNVIDTCREIEGMLIIHTREGHRPQQADVTQHKMSQTDNCIGSPGKYGKILIRGEKGHDIVDELYPLPSEVVLDKPGKGSFYATDLELILKARQIETLLVCGVTTEVCVHTTVREANDRGFHCIVIDDACASYIDEFHTAAIKMIWAQGGIFGSVATSAQVIKGLTSS